MTAAGYASVGVALTLIVLKIWAWLATDSVAMLSSLADSLLDLLASVITLFAVKVAISPADREHRFGHGKSEGIAGLVQAVIITGSAGYVCLQAIERLLAPSSVESPTVGVGVMLASLLLTVSLVAFQRFVVQRTGSLAIAADAVHYRSDILTNIAVLVAILLSSNWGLDIFDPLLGLVVVALILWSVAKIVRGALDVLLDRELPDEDRLRIEEIARAHPEVLGLHDMRTRSAGATKFVQFHLELDPKLSLSEAHTICDTVEREVHQIYPDAEVLIHADPYGLPENRDPF
jgi:ferrous-iron efflux pump FieF